MRYRASIDFDDSLELLRHLLKDTTVTKRYGDVGRVRGYAAPTPPSGSRPRRRQPPDILPRIWDPFFTTKDVGEGHGSGPVDRPRSRVRELVERHGGTIECQTTVGAGTTFTVVLPRQIPIAAKARSAKATGLLPSSRAS